MDIARLGDLQHEVASAVGTKSVVEIVDFDNLRHLVVLKRGDIYVHAFDSIRLRHHRIALAAFAERARPATDVAVDQLATAIRSRRRFAQRHHRPDGGRWAREALALLTESTPAAIERAARRAEAKTRSRAMADWYLAHVYVQMVRCFVRECCSFGGYVKANDLCRAYADWEQKRPRVRVSDPERRAFLAEYAGVRRRTAFECVLRLSGFSKGPGEGRWHPLSLREPSPRYLGGSDAVVAEFVGARCERNPGWFESAAELYAAFAAWLRATDAPQHVTQTSFGWGLRRLGFLNERSSGRVKWHGIRILER